MKKRDHKKRILFLSNHFITLYSFRRELLEKLALMRDKYEVYISTPKDENNSYFSDLGFVVIETPIDRRGVNPIKDLGTLKAYFKIIKGIKPDIIFSYTIKPNIYGTIVSNWRGIKHVCNITGTGSTFLTKNLLSSLAKLMYKLSIKKCYKVFFQNKGDRDFFKSEGLVKDNDDLLPGSGVNLDRYQVTNFPLDEEIRFLLIGRVMKLKGIEEYLEAAKTIKKEYPQTKFYIIGWNEEPEYVEKVNQYASKGIVEYVGFQNNISQWINEAQCVILPSHGGEGVPNVLLEAAASGRVCIASDINGSVDVIDDGKTGFIFKRGNYESLASKIKEFLDLPREERKRMGIAGRSKVEKEFDRNIVIDKYLKELQEI